MQSKNRILPLLLSLFILFTFCTPMLAEEPEPEITVDFKMATKPVYTYEMTSSEILEFFKTEKSSALLDPTKTTMEFGMMVLGEDYQLRDITVLSFKVTDAKDLIKKDTEEELESIEAKLFESIKNSLSKRAISSGTYTYDCEIKTDKIGGKTENLYLYIALYLKDNMESFESDVITGFVRPKVLDWNSLTTAEQILMLNTYILNGQFSYDKELKESKGAVAFLKDKKGTIEDYAGMTALFLDEMGLENIIIHGNVKNSDGSETDHSWNMVKIDDKWYHLDIFSNGPVDENGNHSKVYETYILRSTNAISNTHTPDSSYSDYTKASTEDYNFSPEEEGFDPSRPGLQDYDSERNLLLSLLNNGFEILDKHASEYTEEAINNLTSVYTDCREVYLNENATINEIRSAQKMLDTVISNLTKASAVNKEYLFYNLGKAYEMLYYANVSILYPAEALSELKTIYNSAVEVYQNENATQNQVDSANWSLRSKVAELNALLEPDEPEEPETPIEPTEPTEPTEPIEPTDPTDPENPIVPEDPTQPTDPADPDNPTQPEDPVEPNEPIQPDPIDPVEPVDPNPPVDPKPPIDPTDENKIPTDLLIYAALALVAALGIIFLIVDGIKKRKESNEEEPEETNIHPPEEETESKNESEISPENIDSDDEAENFIISPAQPEKEEDNSESEKDIEPEEDKTKEEVSEIKDKDNSEDQNSEENNTEEKVKSDSEEEKAEETKSEEIQEEEKSSTETEQINASEEEISEGDKTEPESKPENTVIEETESETQTPEKEETKPETQIEDSNSETAEEIEVPKVEDTEIHEIDTVEAESEITESAAASSDEIVAPIIEITEPPKTTAIPLIAELHEEANLKTTSETLAAELKAEEVISEKQIKKEIEANQQTAIDILRQIKKRKKEIKNHEKE